MQINSNSKPKFPQILINDSIIQETCSPILSTPPKTENLTPSPSPLPQNRKKPSTLHTKRFSVNLLPKKSLTRPKIDYNQKHQPRKSSLEIGLGLEKYDLEGKIEEEPGSRKKIVRKETLRKRKINIEEDFEKTEKRLFFTQFFFEEKKSDLVIERNKVTKNWLKNISIELYSNFIINAFNLNNIVFEEFEARKKQNKEKEGNLHQQYQQIINKRLPLESFMPEKRVPRVMLINQKYNSSGCEGILLVKTGSRLPVNVTRRVFFISPFNMGMPETEKRYSFIQIKEKTPINQKKLSKIKDFNEHFKQYPLPESVFMEKRTEKNKWKIKEHDFRISVFLNSREKPLFLYSKTQKDAVEISDYLKFKSFMKVVPHYSLFWKKLAMGYYSKVAGKIFELAEMYNEKLITRSMLFKDDQDDSSSSEDDDNDSGEEKQDNNIIGSSTSLTKARSKDLSLNRKTQQLFLVLKCLQEEWVKYFTKNWLQVAFQTQKQHFETHRSFYGLEPREIMFFETRKKKLIEIETLKKEANVMNFERFVMRRFVANWLEMSSRIYKEKLLMKTTDFNTNKQKNSLKIKLKTITIPCKLDYFKPKIKLKVSRKEIDKARYVSIDKKKVLAEKKEFFQIIYDTHLRERKLGGLLCYEILGKSIEISDFEQNQDFLTFEIFDDSCLSVYEKLKNPNSLNLPADSQEKKLENLDITLFLASSRLITHKTQVFLNDLIGRNSKNKEDYWFSLDYCLDSSNEKTENNPNSLMTSHMGSQENIGNQVVDEGFQEDFKIFLNFESTKFEEEKSTGNKFRKEEKVMDSVFNVDLSGMVQAFLEPKNMKKMGVLQILAGNLSEESMLQLSHEKDIQLQMSKISTLLSLKANEYICKSYVELFTNSSFWFLSKFPSLSDENSIKTRSFFLHNFTDFHSKSPDSIRNLSIKGLPNQLRRLLWGFQHREDVFIENVAKFTVFRTENNIVKPLPTPLIEETLYALFQDEEILLKYDKLNYLSFIQDMTYEIRENINKKQDFRHFLKRNSHHEAILRLLKAAFSWSLINSSRIAATAHLIEILIRLFQVFEGNYPYYHNSCFESRLFKRISPAIYLESDVFWCFITILSVYFPRYFLLEAPKNPVMPSNYYCNSDLRGVKGDLLLLKVYLQEKYLESAFTQDCFKNLRFEGFLSEILISLGIEILGKRIDVWARFFDIILLSKANNEENFLIMGLIGAVFAKILRRTGKSTGNIKTFKEFMLLMSLEVNLIDDFEGFLEFVSFEKKMIKEMREKRGKVIEKFEQEYLLDVHFDRFNKYNRVLYNFSEQIKPFNNFDPSQKLSLSDFYSILSIENLLKDEKKSPKPSLLHVFIHNLTLLYSSSFEGGLILELACEENIREFPIKLIVDTKIELNHYQCLKLEFSKGDAIELKFNIYQTFASEDNEKKMLKKLIKNRKIPLNALTSGILYKNSYNLVSCEQDFNFLTSQISVSLLLGPFSQEKNRWDHLKNNEFAGFNVLFDGRSLWKSIRLCEKEEGESDKKNSFINSFRNLVFENNKIIVSRIKDENALDETQIAENSASCELDPFSWKFRSGLDFMSFQEICKRLFQRDSPEKPQKISLLFDQLINLSENRSKIDFFEFFAGLIIILSGTFESKLELFFRLLVLLNKGNQEIPLILFKGFIIKIHLFLGYFVTNSDLGNFIDNAYFLNSEENLIEKAEIRKITKSGSILFEFSGLLNDFILKKQEMTHSRDLILGSAEELSGLREIIKFYIDNFPEKYQKLTELFEEKNEDFIKFFDLEIVYRSNQGLRQVYTVKIDESWRIIEQDAIFSNITLDFLLRGEANSVIEHKVLNEGFFYNHRNVIVLTSQVTSLMTKKQVLGIMNSLPLFKYQLSLQNLHKVFNKIKDNDVAYFGSAIFEPVNLRIRVNIENGVNFNAGVQISKEYSLVNTKEKLKGLKVKKLALLLESSKSFSIPRENNSNFNGKSGFSKEKQEITTFEISLEKAPFFAPMKQTLQKLLIKIMKKLQELENIEFYSKYSDFIHTFPILNLIDKSLIFNNPIDIENLSFFTLFFLNKRSEEFNFEASFIRKLNRKSDEILSENTTVFSKKARALALFRHCDQSTQWLPADILHSFLPIELVIAKTQKNKQLDLENKHNYDYFTVSFHKFPLEVLMKKPKEVILLRKHDLGNMQIPREIKDFLPKFNKVPKWKEILQGKEEKFGESIFKEILQEDLIVSRKLTIDERKRIERKPGKRVLSYINKKVE